MSQLLIGCGSTRDKRVSMPGDEAWIDLVTLDINPDHKPDVVHDLTQLPLPFDDNTFTQVHAYEVLEHIGQQGDYKLFFAQFSEFWRILKPDGLLMATVPSLKSPWAWGDPSHTRVIPPETLVFLSQAEYTRQVGVTALSDFRYLYKADFETLMTQDNDTLHAFVLQAIKPSRITAPKGAL